MKKIFLAIFIFSVFLTPQFSYAFQIGDINFNAWRASLSQLSSPFSFLKNFSDRNTGQVYKVNQGVIKMDDYHPQQGFAQNLPKTKESTQTYSGSGFALTGSSVRHAKVFDGTHKALFLLVSYKNSSKQVIPKSVFESIDSAIMREMSYGKLDVTFDVRGWFDVDRNYPTEGIYRQNGLLPEEVVLIARSNNISLYDYDRVVVFSKIPGDIGYAWGNPYTKYDIGGELYKIPTIQYGIPAPYDGLIKRKWTFDMHEYGHTLGVGHSAVIACGNVSSGDFDIKNGTTQPQTPYVGNGCSLFRNQSPFSAMGQGILAAHYNVFEKEIMGFLVETTNQNLSDDHYILKISSENAGKFSVNNLQSISSKNKGIKGVKIYPLDKRIKPIYIEMRDGTGVDQVPNYIDIDGSTERIYFGFYDKAKSNFGGLLVNIPFYSEYGPTSYVLDLDPGATKYSLTPGQSYVDNGYGIRINNIKKTSQGVSFDVELFQGQSQLVTNSSIPGLWYPVFDINSFNGPSYLPVGQSGKWNINIDEYNPAWINKNDLPKFKYNYNIDWGLGADNKDQHGALGAGQFSGNSVVADFLGYKDIKGKSKIIPRLSVGVSNQEIFMTFADLDLEKNKDSFFKTKDSLPVLISSITEEHSLRKNDPCVYDFKFNIRGVPCDSVLDVVWGDGYTHKGVFSPYKDLQTIKCVGTEKYIDYKQVQFSHGYNPGKYKLEAKVTMPSSISADQLTIQRDIEVKPVNLNNIRLKRTDKNITLEWWGSVWDGGIDTQVMVSSEKLSTEDQNFSWNFYGDLTAGESGIFKCKPEDTRKNIDCVIKIPGSQSPKLVFEIGPNYAQNVFYFYMRTVDKNKVVASDTIEYVSEPPVDFSPGLSTIIKPINPVFGEPVEIELTVKRSGSVGRQTVKNRLTFADGSLTPDVNLDSMTGAVPDSGGVNGQYLPGKYIIPITVEDGQFVASRKVFVKFKTSQRALINVPINFEVNVGQFKDFVAESNKTNNSIQYKDVLIFSVPEILNEAPRLSRVSNDKGSGTAHIEWSFKRQNSDDRFKINKFVILRSKDNTPDTVPSSVLGCIGSEETLCTILVSSPKERTTQSYDPDNVYYEFTDTKVVNGKTYNYRIYGFGDGVGSTKLNSGQYLFTPSLKIEASLTPVRVVSRSPEYTYAKTILEIKPMADTGLSYLTIDTKSISSDKYIVYTNNDPTCQEFILRETKKCPINLKIHPNADKNYQRISLPVISRDDKTVVVRPIADLVLWPKEFFPRESSYVSIGGITGSSQGSRKIDFNTQNIKEGEIKGFYIPKSGGRWTIMGTAPIASKSLNWSGFGSLPQGEYFVRLCRSYPELNGFFDICSQTVNTFK